MAPSSTAPHAGLSRPRIADGGRSVNCVSALVSHLERLPNVRWALVRRGRSTYLERCERCHDAYGRPVPTPPAARAPRPRDLTYPTDSRPSDRDLALLVRHGREGMPALGAGLSDDDVRALAAFVGVLSPGYETYEVSCVGCHGEDGIPPAGAAAGTRPGVVFDRAYFAAHDSSYLARKIWHMLGERSPDTMPHFRSVLDESQARAIVQYLQILPAD